MSLIPYLPKTINLKPTFDESNPSSTNKVIVDDDADLLMMMQMESYRKIHQRINKG